MARPLPVAWAQRLEACAPHDCKRYITRQIGGDPMYTASKAAFATLVLALVAATVVRAQGVNGSITATATVQSPITVAGVQNLAFGNVFPGVAKTVAYTDATNGGRFDVTGQATTPVTYSFALPTNLTSAGNNLPIGSWTGYVNGANS